MVHTLADKYRSSPQIAFRYQCTSAHAAGTPSDMPEILTLGLSVLRRHSVRFPSEHHRTSMADTVFLINRPIIIACAAPAPGGILKCWFNCCRLRQLIQLAVVLTWVARRCQESRCQTRAPVKVSMSEARMFHGCFLKNCPFVSQGPPPKIKRFPHLTWDDGKKRSNNDNDDVCMLDFISRKFYQTRAHAWKEVLMCVGMYVVC